MRRSHYRTGPGRFPGAILPQIAPGARLERCEPARSPLRPQSGAAPMSLETDHIVDRRRLRRKLTFWRVAAVLIAILGVVGAALVARRSDTSLAQPLTPQISRVTIQGLIRGDQERTEALDNLARSRNTPAVIVHIDNPRCTTAGSQAPHQP